MAICARAKPGHGGGVLGLLAQDRGKGLCGIGHCTFGKHLLGGLHGLAQAAVARHRGKLVHELVDLALRDCALEHVHGLPSEEGHDRRDRLQRQALLRQRAGKALLLVDVDLDQPDLALGGGHGGLQHRGPASCKARTMWPRNRRSRASRGCPRSRRP
jgi:hypothetical protein